MEEKLDLMDGRSKGMHVSTSYPVENADVYDDYDMQVQVAPQIERMQAAHLLPELDFDILDIYADTQYETLVNLDNMNQYVMLFMHFIVFLCFLFVFLCFRMSPHTSSSISIFSELTCLHTSFGKQTLTCVPIPILLMICSFA